MNKKDLHKFYRCIMHSLKISLSINLKSKVNKIDII